MKTFDEAMAIYTKTVPRDDPSAIRRAADEIRIYQKKFEGIAEEARSHDAVMAAIQCFIDNMDPRSAMFSMFILGLQVGMEMEKL